MTSGFNRSSFDWTKFDLTVRDGGFLVLTEPTTYFRSGQLDPIPDPLGSIEVTPPVEVNSTVDVCPTVEVCPPLIVVKIVAKTRHLQRNTI